MMHGRGTSDSAVVALKPTNKAEPSAAEPVVRRTETKGNAGQQSTRRAQDRERVPQALDRIRQVARHKKKERFTALSHHISIDLLRVAFFALKRDAAAGVIPKQSERFVRPSAPKFTHSSPRTSVTFSVNSICHSGVKSWCNR
jgi:hypothetical protein